MSDSPAVKQYSSTPATLDRANIAASLRQTADRTNHLAWSVSQSEPEHYDRDVRLGTLNKAIFSANQAFDGVNELKGATDPLKNQFRANIATNILQPLTSFSKRTQPQSPAERADAQAEFTDITSAATTLANSLDPAARY